MTKAKRKDFYIVPFSADSLGQFEHRLYCHYKRRAVENHGKPIVESMQDISIAIGMGVSTISRARKVLALAGWITVTPGRPDKVTVYETPVNVPVATTNVPVGNVETANKTNDVPVTTISPSVGNDSTFLGNKLRDAREKSLEVEKEPKGSLPPDLPQQSPPTIPDASDALLRHYEKTLGPLTPGLSMQLARLAFEYPEAWVKEAITVTEERAKTSLKYTEGILKRYREEGKAIPGEPKPRKPDTIAPMPYLPTPEERAEVSKLMRELKPDFSAKAGA